MAESPRQVEHVDPLRRRGGGQFLHGRVECALEVDQVRRHVIAAEQGAGQRAPTVEKGVGELAAQHQVVSDPLAGNLLSQRVERLDADGGEGEEIPVPTVLDREGLAVLHTRGRDLGDRVVDGHVPRQTAPDRGGRGWDDGISGHRGIMTVLTLRRCDPHPDAG